MDPIRVASVPFSQVYTRHIGPLPADEGRVVRLDDPRPRRGDETEQSGWWPPAMLEPGWIDEHADDFDLMHVHFGFDSLSPDDLQRVVDDLRRNDKPLVYTVHDLGNPHHTDPSAHEAALDVLVPAADALVTLTSGASAEVRRRWNRDATVLPHPHVLELDTLMAPPPRRIDGPLRFGVHLKSLRPNMATREVVEALVEGVDQLDEPAIVQVNTHPEVMMGGGHQSVEGLGAWLENRASQGVIDLQVHPYFDEDELWTYLASLDASVLPYRWGTHSGWLEACVDLGTAVIAPSCGFYAQQRPVFSYANSRDGLDAQSLARAVCAVADHARDLARTYPRLDPAYRLTERRWVAAEHERIYRGLLS